MRLCWRSHRSMSILTRLHAGIQAARSQPPGTRLRTLAPGRPSTRGHAAARRSLPQLFDLWYLCLDQGQPPAASGMLPRVIGGKGMRWRRDRISAVLYDEGVKHERVGAALGRLLWGSDVRRLYSEQHLLASLPEGSLVIDI